MLQPSSSAVLWWRCDWGVTGARRPTEKRWTNFNSASWLCYTLHEHRISRGHWFEEIDQKLPSNCHFLIISFRHSSPKGVNHVRGKLPAVASFSLVVLRDGVIEGWNRCPALKCTGVILRPAPKRERGGRRKNSEHVQCPITRSLIRHASVGASGYLFPARSINVSLAAQCTASCGGLPV
jgi:hypothetical protein